MKNLLAILFTLSLVCCVPAKEEAKKQELIDIELVDGIYISDNLEGTDSIRLSIEHTELFIKQLNKAEPKGCVEIEPEFWLTIKLNNDSSTVFSVNKNLIKQDGGLIAYALSDSTLVNWLWNQSDYPFLMAERYDPISFIEKMSSNNVKLDRYDFKIGLPVMGEFPDDWVKERHLKELFSMINSKDTCSCYINLYSSHIPNDFAEKGGFARLFIQSYWENKRVYLGLYACPKVDGRLKREGDKEMD